MRKILGYTIIALLAAGMITFWCWAYGWQGVAFIFGWTIAVGGLLYIAIYLLSDE